MMYKCIHKPRLEFKPATTQNGLGSSFTWRYIVVTARRLHSPFEHYTKL